MTFTFYFKVNDVVYFAWSAGLVPPGLFTMQWHQFKAGTR